MSEHHLIEQSKNKNTIQTAYPGTFMQTLLAKNSARLLGFRERLIATHSRRPTFNGGVASDREDEIVPNR